MGYELEDRGSISGSRKRFFSYPQRPGRLWPSTSLLRNGYLGLFLEVKRPGHEFDHSSPSSVFFKIGGAIPPLPHSSSWRGA
jgi:hypothetical protein